MGRLQNVGFLVGRVWNVGLLHSGRLHPCTPCRSCSSVRWKVSLLNFSVKIEPFAAWKCLGKCCGKKWARNSNQPTGNRWARCLPSQTIGRWKYWILNIHKSWFRCMAKTNFCWWNTFLHWHMAFNYTWTIGKPGISMRPPPVSVDVVVVAILRKWKWEKQNDKHAEYQNNILFIIDNINININ